MSQVKLSVGGRDYTVSCADGEEAHVARLGEAIDGKLQQLGASLSNKEAQNLLFAALLLADEVHEQRGDTPGSAAAKATHAERDSELENLRAAHGEAERIASAASSEIEALRADAEAHRVSETALRTELENLKGEHEALSEQLERTRIATSEGAPATQGTFYDDPELPPALERFADLLENCADKLEGKLRTS